MRYARFVLVYSLFPCLAVAGETVTSPPEIAKSVVGPATENSTADDPLHLLDGFQAERLFVVPKETHGSWVSITTDDKGRLIASDEKDKGLYRITPSAVGSKEPTKIEKLDVNLSSAHGLLYAFDSLYVMVNGGIGSGLYRAKDTDGDDQFDEVVKLKELRGGGEHGPHGLRLSPDGKSIYCIGGNHTLPPFDRELNGDVQTMGGVRPAPLRAKLPDWAGSTVAPNWDEDTLLPRQWDGNGHATGILAPGGWIAKSDPDGKTWEIMSIGYRNQYDMDFNADGELFAYDSDMEWDFGMPWYRPTRVNHATSGSDFGWRSGTCNPPSYFIDSLPPLLDIGPGSPVGVSFGYGTKFPAKYQKALYICDWTFGTMYALHLEPSGSTYKAVKEEFVSRTPLPLTDVTIGKDGAMYFTVGGRGTQSELYRVTYVGKESTAPADAHDPAGAEDRALRRKLEAYHRRADDPAAAVKFLWPYLGHKDRFIRVAARTALEHQDVSYWSDKLFGEENPEALLNAAVALARQGETVHNLTILTTLIGLDFAALGEATRLDLLRTLQLTFIRLGAPPEEVAKLWAAKLDPFYPAESPWVNRELCTVLTFLGSPTVVAKSIALMQAPSNDVDDFGREVLARNERYGTTIAAMHANRPETQKLHYAFTLRNAKIGWTTETRAFYFQWMNDARKKSGGASYQNFLKNIDNDAFANVPELERLEMQAGGKRQAYAAPELPKPQGPGKDWTMADLLDMQSKEFTKRRNFENGKRAYASSRCVVCHRFGGEGGATGPDLTQLAGRFNYKDLCEQIVDPSKVVSDLFRGYIVQTTDGKTYTGRIVGEAPDSITMLFDPEDPSKLVTIKKTEIEEKLPAPQSLMPKDLLKPLNQNEVLDLLAYLLSRGNQRDKMFKK